jgi:antiphage defense system Thoeris ThsA-like protein
MTSRHHNQLFLLRDTFHNGFIETTLAGLGGLGTIVGVLGLISSSTISHIPKYTWVVLLGVVIVGSFILRIPRMYRQFAFEPGQWVVELTVGNLFDYEHGIVVTVDRSLSLNPDATGSDSLVGQLIDSWYEHDPTMLINSLSTKPPSANDKDLKLGATIKFFSPGNNDGWLFCLATKTDDGSHTTWQDLAFAYDALWTAMRRENSAAVVVPVIGAGFARTQLPFNGLMLFLILSFHAASLERRVTKSLKIVVTPDEFDARAFSAAANLLDYLGYKPV